jgi:hypothetical protein
VCHLNLEMLQVDLFRNRVQNYVSRLVAHCRPKAVAICMIYYPDEQAGGSWADGSLSLLGYNRNPAQLQCLIRSVFRQATSQIRVEGTRVIPVPLFDVLDGRCSDDYLQRVEPSPAGGKKMANLFYDLLLGEDELQLSDAVKHRDRELERP